MDHHCTKSKSKQFMFFEHGKRVPDMYYHQTYNPDVSTECRTVKQWKAWKRKNLLNQVSVELNHCYDHDHSYKKELIAEQHRSRFLTQELERAQSSVSDDKKVHEMTEKYHTCEQRQQELYATLEESRDYEKRLETLQKQLSEALSSRQDEKEGSTQLKTLQQQNQLQMKELQTLRQQKQKYEAQMKQYEQQIKTLKESSHGDVLKDCEKGQQKLRDAFQQDMQHKTNEFEKTKRVLQEEKANLQTIYDKLSEQFKEQENVIKQMREGDDNRQKMIVDSNQSRENAEKMLSSLDQQYDEIEALLDNGTIDEIEHKINTHQTLNNRFRLLLQHQLSRFRSMSGTIDQLTSQLEDAKRQCESSKQEIISNFEQQLRDCDRERQFELSRGMDAHEDLMNCKKHIPWERHVGEDKTPYYHNKMTKETTYNEPSYWNDVPFASAQSVVSDSSDAQSDVQSVVSDASDAQSVVSDSSDAQSVVSDSSDAQSVVSDSSDAQSVMSDSSDAQSVVSDASDAQSVVSDASDAQSVVSDSSEAQSVVSDAQRVDRSSLFDDIKHKKRSLRNVVRGEKQPSLLGQIKSGISLRKTPVKRRPSFDETTARASKQQVDMAEAAAQYMDRKNPRSVEVKPDVNDDEWGFGGRRRKKTKKTTRRYKR
jgi:hypothetical protein